MLVVSCALEASAHRLMEQLNPNIEPEGQQFFSPFLWLCPDPLPEDVASHRSFCIS